VLDDFKFVHEYFPIVFAYINKELRVLILLSDGEKCRYLKDGICSIYENRPPSCKMYPISPFFGYLLLDYSCPCVGDMGTFLIRNGEVGESNYHERVDDFEEKLAATSEFLVHAEPNLKNIGSFKDIQLFVLGGDLDEYAEFVDMHRRSLSFLGF
jgi:Fe-S-cluster containining protein